MRQMSQTIFGMRRQAEDGVNPQYPVRVAATA